MDKYTNASIPVINITVEDGVTLHRNDYVTIKFDSTLGFEKVVDAEELNYMDTMLVLDMSVINLGIMYFNLVENGQDYSGNTQYKGTFSLAADRVFQFNYNSQTVFPPIDWYSFGGNNDETFRDYIDIIDGHYVTQQQVTFNVYLKVDGSGNVVSVYFEFVS